MGDDSQKVISFDHYRLFHITYIWKGKLRRAEKIMAVGEMH